MSHIIRIRKAKNGYYVHDTKYINGKIVSDSLIDWVKKKKDAEQIRILYKKGIITTPFGERYQK